MNSKTEGTLAIVAALIVLFSAMWEPRVSVAVAVVGLAALGITINPKETGITAFIDCKASFPK